MTDLQTVCSQGRLQRAYMDVFTACLEIGHQALPTD
jgi:hypothetical protein